MSKDDVIAALGEPVKCLTFGTKTVLQFQDFTVELEEGKVVDVKLR